MLSKNIKLNLIKYKKNYSLLRYQYSTKKELATAYKPSEVEHQQNVISTNTPCNSNTKIGKFSLILPPPNVTGHLHLGHALMCTIQDAIARWKRNKGYDVVWVPGMDHAGIATQVVVEKSLFKKYGKSRHDLGRQQFVQEVWRWGHSKGNHIKDDLIKMGTTLDWSKEFFTMDANQSAAVIEAFIQLFENDLIYRDNSMVNWSCALESTISDIEIENMDISGPTAVHVPGYEENITFGNMVDIVYKICGQEGDIVVSTTRPETMLGDVAVAVHPADSRYSHLRDIKLWHPFRNVPIPLITDECVDLAFGTGAVKITPAHDRFDFELAKRHTLDTISVINEKGMICSGFGKYSGIPRFYAREILLNDLSKMGQLNGIKAHKMILPICSRSKDVIEQMIKPQWFLRCGEMAADAIEAVQSGEIKIQPDKFCTEWNRWLSESRDWCISRQLWWGHQIPAYKCSNSDKSVWIAARNEEEARKKCAPLLESSLPIEIVQDEDVLDTWFSSALLPFTVFGWPNTTHPDYKNYYPQDLLETGHDILFFWVARMVMLGKKLTGQFPFRTVLLHGIVCDAHGRKMSKSLGNAIVPDQVIHGVTLNDLKTESVNGYNGGVLSETEFQKAVTDLVKMFPNGIPDCGTDALRFTLCSHNIKSHFISFDVNECYTNKLFFNKIWQATRYTIAAHTKSHCTIHLPVELQTLQLTEMDKWILSRLAKTMRTIELAMDEYNFHAATAALKTFFYQNVCDVYLETTKQNMTDNISAAKINCAVLNVCLTVGLENMKHFAPFFCQELLQHLGKVTIFTSSDWIDENLEHEIEELLNVCYSIRQLKSEYKITKKHQPKAHLFINDEQLFERLQRNHGNIKTLCLCDIVIVRQSESRKMPHFVAKSTAGPLCSFGIEVDKYNCLETTDVLGVTNEKKQQKLEADLERLLKTVSNETYQKVASKKIQKQHVEKIKRIKMELESMNRILR